VDRAVEAVDGDVVIARINDELCVKQLRLEAGKTMLNPANPKYKSLAMNDSIDWELWGRVMFVISEP
jgi:SOS-response transcriptional repressor LexA